jgi:tRNA (cmo5U34)-methyltransferase
MNYVLQFIPPPHQLSVLRMVLARVAPGGYFVFGHKELLHGVPGALAQDEYIQFRLRNGYSRDEIAAKTTALKGSMFTLSNDTILRHVRDAGFEVQETTRWMAFNTFLAHRV